VFDIFLLFRQKYIKIHRVGIIWFGKGWQNRVLKNQQKLILKHVSCKVTSKLS